jgi:hypothetical protein
VVWTIIKGIVIGFVLFVALSYFWYLLTTTHIHNMRIKSCDKAVAPSLKTLDEFVTDSWFKRAHYDVNVYSNGSCMFYTYYPKPGVLYFGQETTSGYMVRVAMTTAELHVFADTISANTSFHQMVDYLSERAKLHPAPNHEL